MSLSIEDINNFQAEIERLKEEKFTVETQYSLKCARVEFLEELVRRIGKRISAILNIEDGDLEEDLQKELELIMSITKEIEG